MDTRRFGVLVLVAGLLVAAHPLYLWPHYGQTPHFVDVAVVDDRPADAAVTDYSALPPAARRAFDAALADGSVELFSESDSEAIEGLDGDGRTYVRKDGTVYAASMYHADGAWLLVTPVRIVLSVLGAATAVIGGSVVARRSFRPLTTAGALWLPVGSVAVLGATALYDTGGIGLHGHVGSWTLAALLATMPAVLGSAVAAGERRTIAGAAAALVAVLGVGFLVPLSSAFVAAIGILVGPSFAIVGYYLSTDDG